MFKAAASCTTYGTIDQHPCREIFSVIKNGVPPDLAMEPWGDRIKDPDIWNVVNYIRSLAKK